MLNSTPHGGKYLHKKSVKTFQKHTVLNNLLTFLCFSGHCKKLAPEYVAAAETLAKNDPPFFLAKVDATEQKKLAEEFGI